MKTIRIGLGGIVAVLLTLGYLASQKAVLNGEQIEYASKIDQQPIVWLALAVFALCLFAFFIPNKGSEE